MIRCCSAIGSPHSTHWCATRSAVQMTSWLRSRGSRCAAPSRPATSRWTSWPAWTPGWRRMVEVAVGLCVGLLIAASVVTAASVVGRTSALEHCADDDRLVAELDAVLPAHTITDLAGEGKQIRSPGAAAVGEREGVFGRNARRSLAVTPSEAGVLDEPGGRDLDRPVGLRPARQVGRQIRDLR